MSYSAYQMTFVEGLLQMLRTRGLYVAPADVIDALSVVESVGIEGADAETGLRVVLLRQTPYHRGASLAPRIFEGWGLWARQAPSDVRELATLYGMDGVRMAAALRAQYAPPVPVHA